MDTTFDICTTNALEHLKSGALLVDVRELRDTQALILDAPDITYLPFSELEQRWHELPHDRELVIMCQNGEKSRIASQFLLQNGYTQVSVMRGGLFLWMQKAYPVIGKSFNTSF